MGLFQNILYHILRRNKRACPQCVLNTIQHAGERFCRYCGAERYPAQDQTPKKATRPDDPNAQS